MGLALPSAATALRQARLPATLGFRETSALLRACALLLIVAGFTAYAVYVAWGETLDDAAISFAYSKNLVHGHGLVLNPGAGRVEAYSNFLWVIVMAPVVAVRLDAIVVSKVLGLVLSAATLLLLANAPAHARAGRGGAWLDLLAPALTALTLPFALWSVSGMENGLLSFLLMLAVVLTFREMRDERALPWSALALCGAALTRPEGIVFFVAAAAHRALLLALGRRAWREDARWLAAFIAPFLIYHVWHYAYFDELVPNTYYAKADHRSVGDLLSYLTDRHDPGFVYVRSFVGDYWLLPALPLALLALAGLERLRAYSLPLLMVLAGGASALFVGGDWMEYHRFLSPLLPLLFLCAQEGVRAIAAAVPNTNEASRRSGLALGGALAAALLAAVAIGSAKEARAAHGEPFGAPYSLIKGRADELEDIGRRLDVGQASVLTPDIGAVGYTTDLNVIDIAGLADAYIARHETPADVANYVFDVRKPDIISLHGVWVNTADLGADPRLREQYVAIRGGYGADGTFLGGIFIRRDRVVFEGTCAGAATWNDPIDAGASSVTISGPVVAETRPDSANDPWLLYLGVPDGPAVVIPPRERAYFLVPPGDVYLGQEVCVTGTPAGHNGAPAVRVTHPRDVRISGDVPLAQDTPGMAGAWVMDGPARTPVADVVGRTFSRAEVLERLAALGYHRILIEPGSDAERFFRSAATYTARDLQVQFGAPDLWLREVAPGRYRWAWMLSSSAVERVSASRFAVPDDIDPDRPGLDFDLRYTPAVVPDRDAVVTFDVAYYQTASNIVDNVARAPVTSGAQSVLRISPDARFLRTDAYTVVVIRLGDDPLDTYPAPIFLEGLRILYWPHGMREDEASGMLVYDLS